MSIVCCTMRHDFLIHSNFSPKNIGGVERVVDQISIEIKNSLPKSKICHFYGDTESYKAIKDDTLMIARKIKFSKFGIHILSYGNLNFIIEAMNSRKIIFNDPFPSLWIAAFMLRCLGKDIVFFCHAYPKVPILLKPLYDFLLFILYFKANVITTSDENSRYLPKSAKLHVVPLWLDDELKFTEMPGLIKRPYFLYVGRLSSYKGVELIAQVIPRLPEVQFVVAGKGPNASCLVNLIKSKAVNNLTLIHRFVTEEEKNTLIKNAHALLFPSTNTGEAFGIVQLEAMRLGIPIINTQLNTGVNAVGKNGVNALTVLPNNSNEIECAICKLTDDQVLHENLSAGARKLYSSSFRKEVSIRKLLNILLDGVNNK